MNPVNAAQMRQAYHLGHRHMFPGCADRQAHKPIAKLSKNSPFPPHNLQCKSARQKHVQLTEWPVVLKSLRTPGLQRSERRQKEYHGLAWSQFFGRSHSVFFFNHSHTQHKELCQPQSEVGYPSQTVSPHQAVVTLKGGSRGGRGGAA